MSILKGKLEFVRICLQSWLSQDNWLGGLEGEESWADSDVAEASPSALLGGLKTWRALVPQKTLSLNLVLTAAWDPISTLSDRTPVCFPHHFVGLKFKKGSAALAIPDPSGIRWGSWNRRPISEMALSLIFWYLRDCWHLFSWNTWHQVSIWWDWRIFREWVEEGYVWAGLCDSTEDWLLGQ